MNTDEVVVQLDGECDILHKNPQSTVELYGDTSSALNCSDQLVETTGNEHSFTAAKTDVGINTDFNWESWCTMEETIKFQQEIIAMLFADLKEALSHSQRLENDDQQTYYYTGLTSYAVFDNLSALLSTVLSKNPNTSKGKLRIKRSTFVGINETKD